MLTAAAGIYLYTLTLSLPDLAVGSATGPAESSIVYAADGSVLATWHGEQDRTVVALEDVPHSLRDAVVAVEDSRFWEHHGVDGRAIVKAAWASDDTGEIREGGSTITQQLVNLLFPEGERTLGRKVRETLLAYQLETKADKDKVLETYLNVVYFGAGSYGVESASQTYFGKHASDLDIAESATLAGVIAAPSRYGPLQDPEAAKERRDRVLVRMRDLGQITEEQRRNAAATRLVLAPPADSSARAPYFVEWVKQQLIDSLGAREVYEGGLRVHTTLDPVLQDAAEEAARRMLPDPADPEVALVCIEHATGEVVAMVGGRDFASDQFNLAVQGKRQPGSAFKPFVLVTALEQGVRPDDQFLATPYSVPVSDGVWTVQNYENAKTAPRLTLRAATNWSVNAVYARLIMKVGAQNVVKTARSMGITSELEANPAIALGGLSKGVSPLEMAAAYGTLASQGVRTPPFGVTKVSDRQGKTRFEAKSPSERVLSEQVAMKASLMLHDVVQSGTASEARIPEWSAGKTGTTQSYRDAWFVGYSGDLVTSVWVGYRDAQVDMTDVHGIRVTGGSFPAKIWKAFMTESQAQRRAPVTPPSGAATGGGETLIVRICTDGMVLANSRCPQVVEVQLEHSLVPKQVCRTH